ncbi:MAG TPA: hypothetical protein VI732_04805 [Alphaproteobacteria bacterium]|nr:hypothetical protein [Alphaproteobacteria bacterium]
MTDPKFPWALAANIGIGRKNERRLTGRALLYWWTLKGDLHFPRHSTLPLDSAEVKNGEGLWPNFFTVALDPSAEASTFVYCGTAVADICMVPPEGRLVSTCLPSPMWDKLRYVFESTATMMKPLTASGRFLAASSRVALYRSIALPLSEDGSSIDHLLGALNFKYEGR